MQPPRPASPDPLHCGRLSRRTLCLHLVSGAARSRGEKPHKHQGFHGFDEVTFQQPAWCLVSLGPLEWPWKKNPLLSTLENPPPSTNTLMRCRCCIWDKTPAFSGEAWGEGSPGWERCSLGHTRVPHVAGENVLLWLITAASVVAQGGWGPGSGP